MASNGVHFISPRATDPHTAPVAPFAYGSPCGAGVLEAVAAQAAADTTARIRAAIASSSPFDTAAAAASAAAVAAACVGQKRCEAALVDSRPGPSGFMWRHASIPAAPSFIPRAHHSGQHWQLLPPSLTPATAEPQARCSAFDVHRDETQPRSARIHESAMCHGNLLYTQRHEETREQGLFDSKQTVSQLEEENRHLKKALELSRESEKTLRLLLEEEKGKSSQAFRENEILKSELEETRKLQHSSLGAPLPLPLPLGAKLSAGHETIGAYPMCQNLPSPCRSPGATIHMAMVPKASNPAEAETVAVVEVDMTEDMAVNLPKPHIK